MRFGYVIQIIVKFSELLLSSSPRIITVLKSDIKRSKEVVYSEGPECGFLECIE